MSTKRALADPVDADLLDHVVAGTRRVQRGHVRRPRQEAPHAGRVLELRLERERARVALPADERRLEPLREIRPDVQPACAGPAAQPLDAAADGEVDVERGEVERDDAGRLVAIEHDVCADLVRAAHDRLDVLDLGVLEEHVADRHEQRALVDRLDDRAIVLDGDDLEIGLRLVEVAHRREVRLLVDDAVARAAARADGALRKHEITTSSATVTFWCMTIVPGAAPMIRASWSPIVTGISHHPSPHARMPRSRHMRAYSSSRSSAAAGIAAREWLIR